MGGRGFSDPTIRRFKLTKSRNPTFYLAESESDFLLIFEVLLRHNIGIGAIKYLITLPPIVVKVLKHTYSQLDGILEAI